MPELLALAAQLCTRPTLIPQALLHYERGICAEDAFSAHGKRAFIMSHVLDMTGAPIVLVSAVPVLRSMGYEVLVLGPSDGGSLHLFLDAGASVITRSSCRNVSDAWGMALCADFVIANTVVMARAVRALSGTAVPVLWWLHDAFAGYPHIAHQIPTQLGENVRVYSVGSHAANAMRAVRPEFEIRPLIYGLPDYAAENFVRTDLATTAAALCLPRWAPLSAARATISSARPSACCRPRCGRRPPSSLWARPLTRR